MPKSGLVLLELSWPISHQMYVPFETRLHSLPPQLRRIRTLVLRPDGAKPALLRFLCVGGPL